MNNWNHLEQLLEKLSAGPWTVQEEGEDVVVVNSRGEDVTGLAPKEEALADYTFISTVRNDLTPLLEDYYRLTCLLIENKVCLDCSRPLNRQLFCVKCGISWNNDNA